MALLRKEPQLQEERDESARYSIAVGNTIGELARALFPGGVLVPFSDDKFERTRELIEEQTPVIYEAAFQGGQAVAILDVLVRQPDGTYHAYEAKSAKSAKDSYYYELAIQGVVAAENGVRISGYFIIHVNGDSLYDGSSYTTDLLSITEVTPHIVNELDVTSVNLALMHNVMNADKVPDADLKFVCKGCHLIEHCHGVLPDDHQLFLPGMTTKEFETVRGGGTIVFSDNPTKVKDFQRVNFSHALKQQGCVTAEGKQTLADASFPQVFLDFEVFAARLPIFAGTKPYDQLQFQFSAHIREHAGAELQHVEYLPEHDQDPRAEFGARLHQIIKDAGTIFTYSHYEGTQLRNMLKNEFEFADLNVAKLEQCEIDLYKVVKRHTYHPKYRGSFSIKSVLPAWVPELSYKELAIQDGITAAIQYGRLIQLLGTPEGDQLRADMLAYCRLDTLAMVKVYDALLAFEPKA
ncbi:MAG: DUF2779 domain-containing protein [Chthonomonas sp.]|nr:DUF2779 domain-containing protein [Chthonomonas sp.]